MACTLHHRAIPTTPGPNIMLNLIRKFLRPTLREQLEAGVREALRRYADRHTSPSLRVFVSTDLVPPEVDPQLWSQDEAEHLRRFAHQWAEDNHVPRAGLRVEVVLLDTKREFAFVKPLALDRPPAPNGASGATSSSREVPMATTLRGRAILEITSGNDAGRQLEVEGETIFGRRSGAGVRGLEDRYMSARHARMQVDNGHLQVIDLDSKNRTYLNDEALPPHRPRVVNPGDEIRMGTTIVRVIRVDV